MPHAILLIGEDLDLQQKFEQALNSQGYVVLLAQDMLQGLVIVADQLPDIVILHHHPVDSQSISQFCIQIKTLNRNAAIIFLGNSQEICDRISGLDAGADDYIHCSISMKELFARVRSKLRRLQWETETVCYSYEDILLNTRTRQVYRGDRELDLTAKEFDFLAYFIRHPQQVLSREKIYQTIWQDNLSETSNVIEVYIRYLRLKLESAGEPRLIHTVRSIGYILKKAATQHSLGLSTTRRVVSPVQTNWVPSHPTNPIKARQVQKNKPQAVVRWA